MNASREMTPDEMVEALYQLREYPRLILERERAATARRAAEGLNVERLVAILTDVLDDAESQHPGGWGPDVTTVALIREVRNALAAKEPSDQEEVVGNCPECDAPIGGDFGCRHWPADNIEAQAAPSEGLNAERLAEAYADRNLVVQAFGQAMEALGWRVAWGIDPSEPDWPVLYIETPEGQVSWHVPKGERIYEPRDRSGSRGPVKWDGHSNEEKAARLRATLAAKEPQ